MKLTSAFFALGLVQAVLAESLGPSPTESVGCEPHGDHWCVFPSSSRQDLHVRDVTNHPLSRHCEGPAPTEDSAAASTDDADASEDPGPSPTESEGCEPHGDHWCVLTLFLNCTNLPVYRCH